MNIEFDYGAVSPQVLSKVVETIISSIPMERNDLIFPYMNLEFHVTDDTGELLLDDKLRWRIADQPIDKDSIFIEVDGRPYYMDISIEEETP